MNSEDDISNAGNENNGGRHVVFETSTTTNDSESSELDKYLDEAMDSDDNESDYKESQVCEF